MNPRVKKVRPNDDFTIEITFDNDEVKVFDMKPYLEIGVFKELKNISEFKTVKVSLGSIQWRNGQDLCPDTLYLDSKRAA
ncbi:MAG: hypothetical protein A2504_07230 [Bdellovibrionales bacterium RIFOXYD12_FULL_39_22]|nr:MAG: hypothetical protein A2385_16600 [Bdellovibrionales bacterium RIFOXYB1_FULL_39_21]OFZ44671.1 MAG: hypothetical protein A2485_14460 [Bdellovibrionales bacterium RIFOXYC12_FULL_39_17]OFZ49301.1 MAG: hypothetical protein A2404_08755 [Bdellovibrionales bacterium RIFOXYC1_FULL_39_130]OFZ72598.1 MAG: hypothetical protein A2451_00765 [Bdellovibrionales bacterium RIFOXYC2_FULL_39_8]OFZ77037.1 MAG: hypothetical protein A2560_09720 [Bdellovibrionales bacterium RIFOXYD1_FULL_39_84]OFZ95297.1 MAG: